MKMNDTRFGFVAVIGPPNAGKSTLANALIGQKVSIVTHKTQTTRARLRGVVIEGKAQIILVDTPGVFDGQRKMDRAMVHEAWAGANDADVIAVVLDVSKRLPKETEMVLAGIQETTKPVMLILNKIDAVRHETLLGLVDELSKKANFKEIFMVSALKEQGLEELRQCLSMAVPEGVWQYPEDMAADVPSLFLAAEVTREKLFLRMHQELPYALTVETEKWTRQKNGSVKIEQVIYVRRDTQKAIILGKNGRAIKEIGQQARLDMEEIFDHRVHLFLFVKVRENWIEDPERMRMMGITSSF